MSKKEEGKRMMEKPGGEDMLGRNDNVGNERRRTEKRKEKERN